MDGHWTAGYGEYEFASNSSGYLKGCYGYLSGKYAGHYFFGTGGSEAEMSTYLTGETFRPKCVKGIIRQNFNVPNIADHTVVFLNKLHQMQVHFSHLSKWPSDLKINGTQENVTFSGPVFHVASVSFNNHPLNGWNFSTANRVLLLSGF